jgi:hypothetical protein
MVVLCLVLAIILGLLIALFIVVNMIGRDLMTLQSDMAMVRRIVVPPNVGGRLVPSGSDIAAAMARAGPVRNFGGPNQVDSTGTAHVGGPSN